MFIKILFNTDGFLGGHIVCPSKQKLEKSEITAESIQQAKHRGLVENNRDPLIVEMDQAEYMVFNMAVTARDGIEVLPSNAQGVPFGNMKLKFNDDQKVALLKRAKEAHAITAKGEVKKKNEHEQLFEAAFEVDKAPKSIFQNIEKIKEENQKKRVEFEKALIEEARKKEESKKRNIKDEVIEDVIPKVVMKTKQEIIEDQEFVDRVAKAAEKNKESEKPPEKDVVEPEKT